MRYLAEGLIDWRDMKNTSEEGLLKINQHREAHAIGTKNNIGAGFPGP